MAKPAFILLGDDTEIPILYEDRSVIAIDKPAGWMLVPYSWQRTSRNLQAAIVSSISAGEFWARSRGLRFLRHVHRLDAETTGVLLMARSPGAVQSYGQLFESRRMDKTYLVVVTGVPAESQWVCRAKIGPDSMQIGRMRVDERSGKEAETEFIVREVRQGKALLEARPWTGRTHQIRVHLAAAGLFVLGDPMYGPKPSVRPGRRRAAEGPSMALRAVSLAYVDPFTRRRVLIEAPAEPFLRRFGFAGPTPGS